MQSTLGPASLDDLNRINPLTPTAAVWVQLMCQTGLSRHPGTTTLSPERQSARMSKITNDGLTQSGTGCFIDVPIWQHWASRVNYHCAENKNITRMLQSGNCDRKIPISIIY